jgi:UDP-2,4-diacetamido-2,4,6-trideoxy-beta-L-altropyranose hydrolase
LKNNQLTIITEGGKNFGFGHITRCLSIEKIFKQYDYKSFFIINGDKSISKILSTSSYILLNWIEKQKELLQQFSNSSLILIDSILISNQQILDIQKLNIPIIFIDDEKHRNILDSGFVIDWTVLSEQQNYFSPKKKNVSYLLGSLYTPLREQFTSATLNNINESIDSIMLTFGGADVRNLTPTIIKALINHFPNIQKNIVIGAGFTNIDEIEKQIDNNTHLIFNANSKTMIELMQKNDLAIACGGQTLYELARIGTPTIAILVVDNAKDDTLGWEKVGSVKYIGWWDNTNLIDNLITTIHNLQDKKIRQSMQNKAKQYISPNGAKILVKKIIDNLQ